jgi:hypothetical protein
MPFTYHCFHCNAAVEGQDEKPQLLLHSLLKNHLQIVSKCKVCGHNLSSFLKASEHFEGKTGAQLDEVFANGSAAIKLLLESASLTEVEKNSLVQQYKKQYADGKSAAAAPAVQE